MGQFLFTLRASIIAEPLCLPLMQTGIPIPIIPDDYYG